MIIVVPANKQKSLFNKYCHDLGEKLKDEKKKKNSKVKSIYIYIKGMYRKINIKKIMSRNQRMNLENYLHPKSR